MLKRKSPTTHHRRAHKRKGLVKRGFVRATTVFGRPPLKISRQGYITNLDELYRLPQTTARRRIRLRRIIRSPTPIQTSDVETAFRIYQQLEPEYVNRPESAQEIRGDRARYFVFSESRTRNPIGVGSVDANTSVIQRFGVLPAYRRHGYGISILHSLENYLVNRGKRTAFLWIRTTNMAMQNLAQRMGYERTGQVNEKSVQYKKELSNENRTEGEPLRMEKV